MQCKFSVTDNVCSVNNNCVLVNILYIAMFM